LLKKDGVAMKAAVIDGYGGRERLEIREVPRPEPGVGQILIRMLAAGVNPVDYKLRNGSFRLVMPAKFPLVLGFDAAGVVEAVGPEVDRFEPGDRVYAYLDNRHGGAYAEYALAGQAVAAEIPPSLSFEEAAAVPLAATTALLALRDKGEITAGDEVLINGASGGVGHFAVQIASLFGARVTAVAGERHRDFLFGLGAQRFLDYRQGDFLAVDVDYRIVFDVFGNLTFADCDPVLADGGVFVSTQFSPGILLSTLKTAASSLFGETRRARYVVVRPDGEALDDLSRWVEQGKLRPSIDRVYPLEEIRQAHEAVESGHTRGKVVVRIAGE
jgi:NADPH:quinone reductase-like Zn-dependent oxidoreductase